MFEGTREAVRLRAGGVRRADVRRDRSRRRDRDPLRGPEGLARDARDARRDGGGRRRRARQGRGADHRRPVQRRDEGLQRGAHRARGVRRRADRARRARATRSGSTPTRAWSRCRSTTPTLERTSGEVDRSPSTEVHAGRAREVRAHRRLGRPRGGDLVSPHPTITSPAALQCRICGQQYPVEPLTICEECFGPLEPAYDLQSVDGDGLPQAGRAGPQSLWRYESLLPGGPDDRSGRPGRRVHAAPSRRQPGRGARACSVCGSRTTRSTRRTPSRTGS